MSSPTAAMLGERLHLQHGPIDLIVSADGEATEMRAAYAQAQAAFGSLLQDLVDELPMLRRDAREVGRVTGPVARRMLDATSGHGTFVTPMAAVAGAVADHVLAKLCEGRSLQRASVNNGGDIALWLAPDECFRVGVCADPESGQHAARATIHAGDGVGGIATSGWRGRSHSLGIADAVTVLAGSAAVADAAATLIANAVDLPGSSAVSREVAEVLSPDSDLGSRLVTTDVGAVSLQERAEALDAGERAARSMIERRLIASVFLSLQGDIRTVGVGRLEEFA